MDVNAIISGISNLGFPIACVIALFYMWQRETDSHREETKELTTAIQNNTLVMQKLIEKLEGE